MNADVENAVERAEVRNEMRGDSGRYPNGEGWGHCYGVDGYWLPKDAWQTIRQALRDQETEIARLRGVADLIPTTWLDPLLTGQDAVIGGQPYDGHDIENLLRALRERITAHLGGEHE